MGLTRLKPNTTQIPNIILDDWTPELSPAEFKVVMIIARQTYGWHKELDRISYSQLQEKTGYKTDAIVAAIRSLRQSGKIIVTDSKGVQLHTKEECQGKSLYYQLNLLNLSEKPRTSSRKNRDTKETMTKVLSQEIKQTNWSEYQDKFNVYRKKPESDVGRIIKRRNQNVDQILKEFSELTGYSQPTDRKARYWAYLFTRHKGVDNFRPCLKFLLEIKKYDLNKLETVYRKFPVFDTEVLAVKKKAAEKFEKIQVVDRWGQIL